MPLFFRRIFGLLRTLPLPGQLRRGEPEREDVGEEDWDEHPPPSAHVHDLRVDVVMVMMVIHGKFQHGCEPGFGCPLVGRVGDIRSCDGLGDVLPFGLVGDDENEDEGG